MTSTTASLLSANWYSNWLERPPSFKFLCQQQYYLLLSKDQHSKFRASTPTHHPTIRNCTPTKPSSRHFSVDDLYNSARLLRFLHLLSAYSDFFTTNYYLFWKYKHVVSLLILFSTHCIENTSPPLPTLLYFQHITIPLSLIFKNI